MEKNKKFKFVIVSPRNNGGGAIVLHALCKYLGELGYDAKMFYAGYFGRHGSFFFWYKWIMFTLKDLWMLYTAPYFARYFRKQYFDYIDIPIANLKRQFWPSVDDDTVVVYPEVAKGNFLKGKHVVRWLLYYNKFQDKDIDIAKDMFVCFRHEFNDLRLNPKGITLYCTYYNLELYKQTNFGKRIGKCYIIRKGRDRDDLPDKFDGPIIDDMFETDKVKVMNECEYCISYDTQTAYNRVAALCGCISVVMPEPDKGIETYRNQYDKRYGVAIGFAEEQIRYARETVGLLLEEHMNINRLSKDSVEGFVRICHDKFL